MSLPDLESRFWQRVDQASDCWLWTGGRFAQGYGSFYIGDRYLKAHRYSWCLHNGLDHDSLDSSGLCVCHTCDNRLCVNPEHLFLGTNADNVADRVAKGRCSSGARHGATQRGLRNHQAVVPVGTVYAIRHAAGTQQEIAKKFGVSRQHVGQIRRRERWGHLPELESTTETMK